MGGKNDGLWAIARRDNRNCSTHTRARNHSRVMCVWWVTSRDFLCYCLCSHHANGLICHRADAWPVGIGMGVKTTGTCRNAHSLSLTVVEKDQGGRTGTVSQWKMNHWQQQTPASDEKDAAGGVRKEKSVKRKNFATIRWMFPVFNRILLQNADSAARTHTKVDGHR